MKRDLLENPKYIDFDTAAKQCALGFSDVEDAAARQQRFAAYFNVAFPETTAMAGIVESPFRRISGMQDVLEDEYGVALNGELYLKIDSHLLMN